MPRRPHVTDHAVLRYMERVMGYDIEAVRALIATQVETAVAVGACGLKKDGFTFRLEGENVVTVYRTHSDPRRICDD
ncbi:hypothetical protein ACVDG3_06845 [Meridianimarinicoccus sp. RP-17]|uniref:hypothetical protein n=1 Tax=Meridianimarinicoccus zhengii TaxID=2056810 RepID=UPI000DAEE684|nr:hypothetical protein [Phycocomes zhengii]